MLANFEMQVTKMLAGASVFAGNFITFIQDTSVFREIPPWGFPDIVGWKMDLYRMLMFIFVFVVQYCTIDLLFSTKQKCSSLHKIKVCSRSYVEDRAVQSKCFTHWSN